MFVKALVWIQNYRADQPAPDFGGGHIEYQDVRENPGIKIQNYYAHQPAPDFGDGHMMRI